MAATVASEPSAKGHLFLCEKPLCFDTRDCQVYLDSTTKRLIIFKQNVYFTLSFFEPRQPLSPLALINPGQVFLLRFSPDDKFLAIQRSENTVEFFNIPGGWEVTQTCRLTRAPNNVILGFFWVDVNAVVYVTSYGLELFKVSPDQKPLKSLKTINYSVAWFLYLHDSRVVLLSSGHGNSLQGFQIQVPGLNTLKLPRFDIDVGDSRDSSGGKAQIRQSDVTLGRIYDKTYCLHLNSHTQELVMYQLGQDVVMKTHKIQFYTPKAHKFALSIVDNVIVVHNIESKTTLLYDIKTSTKQSVGSPHALRAFTRTENTPAPWAPPHDGIEPKTKTEAPADTEDGGVQLYTSDWRFYSPDFILDTRQGYLWQLNLDLAEIALGSPNKVNLMQFLLRRSRAKSLVLKVLKTLVEEQESLATLAKIFDILNNVCATAAANMNKGASSSNGAAGSPQPTPQRKSRSWWNFGGFDKKNKNQSSSSKRRSATLIDPVPTVTEQTASSALPPTAVTDPDVTPPGETDLFDDYTAELQRTKEAAIAAQQAEDQRNEELSRNGEVHPMSPDGYTIVKQADLYTFVFSSVEESGKIDFKYMVALIMEYIRSLNYYEIPVEHFLFQFVIDLLVKHQRYYQLHQFLQYHVVTDSKPVACQLLSLDKVYPPCYQLALDMLNRLKAYTDIVEVLLLRQQILDALTFTKAHKLTTFPPKRFLQAASQTGDDRLFYTVYSYFEQRNRSARGTPMFQPEDDCGEYVAKYELMLKTQEASAGVGGRDGAGNRFSADSSQGANGATIAGPVAYDV